LRISPKIKCFKTCKMSQSQQPLIAVPAARSTRVLRARSASVDYREDPIQTRAPKRARWDAPANLIAGVSDVREERGELQLRCTFNDGKTSWQPAETIHDAKLHILNGWRAAMADAQASIDRQDAKAQETIRYHEFLARKFTRFRDSFMDLYADRGRVMAQLSDARKSLRSAQEKVRERERSYVASLTNEATLQNLLDRERETTARIRGDRGRLFELLREERARRTEVEPPLPLAHPVLRRQNAMTTGDRARRTAPLPPLPPLIHPSLPPVGIRSLVIPARRNDTIVMIPETDDESSDEY
jgi:hypothetical protein